MYAVWISGAAPPSLHQLGALCAFGPTSGTSVNVTDTPHGGKCTLTTTDASGFRSVGSGGATVAADGSTKVMLTDQTYVATAGSPVGTRLLWTLTGWWLQRSIRCAFTTGSGAPRNFSTPINECCVQWRRVQPGLFGNPLDEDASGANAFYLEYDFTAAGSDVTMTLTCETASTPPQLFGATLQQTAGPPPPLAAAAIATQPVSFTNWVGLTNSLSVTASGNPMPTYQWYQTVRCFPARPVPH